ncbi:MAG: GIY-YIG nuclease family protein [Okeania sp. SIO3I5]|uniref:GIY-YIG nuclease family protein n=1 Tax=Okeania sp. SIO3I5 TaxID=2607805 RepID=UPI0013B7C061|nr:GIY-YIG nuclease family protein [Okeania sp. SIO3I5]NEQ38399.1 GIY-YIG nuclease family protein [Okeania sp. SIO3I5]
MTEIQISELSKLEYLPYVDSEGKLPLSLEGKIGVYGIFGREKELLFIGYSRDIYQSLKQHLVRQPLNCYWLKVQTIERPNRSILEGIKAAWINENGSLPIGNGATETKWNQPIDAKQEMTEAERIQYQDPLIDEVVKEKLLKNIARRVEANILEVLKTRGLQENIRFNPKLKTSGLLDLK